MKNYKVEKLERGETFTTSEKGNSMVPFIKSGQKHILEPATWKDVGPTDIVYCKVKGNFYTHMVREIDPLKDVQIQNASGYINGWTKQVYGKVIKIL